MNKAKRSPSTQSQTNKEILESNIQATCDSQNRFTNGYYAS